MLCATNPLEPRLERRRPVGTRAWQLRQRTTPLHAAPVERYRRIVHRIFTTSVSSVYPHYVTKVERKGRTKAELDEVITWLTGYSEATLQEHLAANTTFDEFFAEAQLNPKSSSITGVVSVQADKGSVEWRRRFAAMLNGG